MMKLKKIIHYAFALSLSIGIILGQAIVFFLSAIWIGLIGISLYYNYYGLLKVIAPDYPVERIKQENKLNRHIWASIIFALILFSLGLLVQMNIL